MRGIIFSSGFVLATLVAAMTTRAAYDRDPLPGTIERPGYSQSEPVYVNSAMDNRVRHLQQRFEASYVAINDRIPAQAIVVSPNSKASANSLISGQSVEAVAGTFLQSYGVIPADYGLELVAKNLVMNKLWYVNLRKTVGRIPVHDAGIGLCISVRGIVNVLWGNLNPVPQSLGSFSLDEGAALRIAQRGLTGSVTKTEYIGRVILPLFFDGRTEYHPAHRFMISTMVPFAEWEVFVDAENGQILERMDKVVYDIVSGNASGSIQPLTPFDEWVDRSFYDMNLAFSGYDPVTTDSLGNYSIDILDSNPLDVYVRFSGPYFEVMNYAGSESEFYANVDPPDTLSVYWDDSNSIPPERDAWYSGVFIHKWIDRLDPGLAVMDFPMLCNVNINDVCNAFWSGWSLSVNFYAEGGGCPNTAQIADVVYHEYGHGITDLMTRPLGPDGAMHEGFSDYTACTITNQNHVGLGFFGPGTYLRDLQNNRRYPRDWSGESHNDGLIIGGALWDTRQALSPYPMGYVDSLWHFARFARTQDFQSYFWAFVTEDDDDGDISNGTPNAAVIFHAFGDLHGIGPGTSLTVTSDTLLDTEDTTHSYTVHATINSFFAPIADSVLLYYDEGAGFTPVHMIQDGSVWSGSIPPQNSGTQIDYYVLAVNQQGFRGTAPPNAPATYFSFYVGPDTIAPGLTLVEGPPNTVNLFGPYGPFVVTGRDINGINPSEVRLHYAVNSEQEQTAFLAPSGNDGEFSLQSIDLHRQLQTGDTVHYYFTALDGAHIPNTGRLPLSGTLNLLMATYETFEDFERFGMDRWVADSGWVLRNDGYVSGHSIWFSSPNYPDNADASITMGFTYDLSPYPGARVTFYRKSVIQSEDTCYVEASYNDGLSWVRVGAMTSVTQWRYTQFDISSILRPYAHNYRVRFRFVSDGSGNGVGILLDNIGWSVDPSTGIEVATSQLPDDVSLSQNYPNPFNPETRIQFTLSERSHARLEIFDVLGRSVSTLVNQAMNAGDYNATWNGQDRNGNPAASGVYFYRLTTDQGTRQAKMTLLR